MVFISIGAKRLLQKNLIPRDRCARIDYAGDFHVDVIPATAMLDYHKPYAVPAKDRGSWITNDPVGYTNWVEGIDRRAAGIDGDGVGRFVRSCRMMKRWRDTNFSTTDAPSSIVLVTMLGKHDPSKTGYNPPLSDPLYPKYPTDLAYLYDMLRLTHSCLDAARRSAFTHPTLPKEDLAGGWDEKYLKPFMTVLQACIDNLRLGIYSKDEKASLKHYKDGPRGWLSGELIVFKILSLDGGGIRGAFIAAFLAKIQENLNVPLVK